MKQREAQEVFTQMEGNVTNSKACLSLWTTGANRFGVLGLGWAGSPSSFPFPD